MDTDKLFRHSLSFWTTMDLQKNASLVQSARSERSILSRESAQIRPFA